MLIAAKLDSTPIGSIWVAASDRGIALISLWADPQHLSGMAQRRGVGEIDFNRTSSTLLSESLHELSGYLQGELQDFTVPIDWSIPGGFQKEVLEQVVETPYGRLTTYQTIADQLDKPGAARAVGRANATNPLPLIIPCHRVLSTGGKLHGYSAPDGLETKAWLLKLEGSWLL